MSQNKVNLISAKNAVKNEYETLIPKTDDLTETESQLALALSENVTMAKSVLHDLATSAPTPKKDEVTGRVNLIMKAANLVRQSDRSITSAISKEPATPSSKGKTPEKVSSSKNDDDDDDDVDDKVPTKTSKPISRKEENVPAPEKKKTNYVQKGAQAPPDLGESDEEYDEEDEEETQEEELSRGSATKTKKAEESLSPDAVRDLVASAIAQAKREWDKSAARSARQEKKVAVRDVSKNILMTLKNITITEVVEPGLTCIPVWFDVSDWSKMKAFIVTEDVVAALDPNGEGSICCSPVTSNGGSGPRRGGKSNRGRPRGKE